MHRVVPSASASIVPGSTDTSWSTPPSGPLRGVAVHEESGTIRDVLIERAPQRDVQQLVAPADGEDRDVAVHRRIDQRELEPVGHLVDPVDGRMRILAVAAGIDVRHRRSTPARRTAPARRHRRASSANPVGGSTTGSAPARSNASV